MDSYISRYDVLEKDYGEQIRICERIDKINRLIQLHKEEIIELEKITKSRFVEMFGNPVLNEKGWRTKPLLDMGNCKN